MNRRAVLMGAGASLVPQGATAAPAIWTFDNLQRIDGHSVQTEGAPKLIDSSVGSALEFDGQNDVLFIDNHPLSGASAFTLELIFRPDGGAFEQRLLHLESKESPPVPAGKGKSRMLVEIRVVDAAWYLDAFMIGPGYRVAMMVPEKTFALRNWYHVAQVYDGEYFRSFVNGELQMQVATPFKPQAPGHASVGARMNRVSHFCGAIRKARFTPKAQPPQAFMSLAARQRVT